MFTNMEDSIDYVNIDEANASALGEYLQAFKPLMESLQRLAS